ncbi:unnamed protein product [Ectocarpus sp. 4 AP-2014]
MGTDYLVANRSATEASQFIGLTRRYLLSKCVEGPIRHGKQILRFVQEATTQQRVTASIVLRNGVGNTYREQLRSRIYEILPTLVGETQGRYREKLVYRVVHLGLERYCMNRRLLPALDDDDLRKLVSVLRVAETREREEDGEDVQSPLRAPPAVLGSQLRSSGTVSESDTPVPPTSTRPGSTPSASANVQPPTPTVGAGSQPNAVESGGNSVSHGGLRPSESSPAVDVPRGAALRPGERAPLPRHHPNVGPRVRETDVEEAARRHLGEQTSPRARAALAGSWHIAQANVGSGSRLTATGSEERHTRNVQAERMADEFPPREHQPSRSMPSAHSSLETDNAGGTASPSRPRPDVHEGPGSSYASAAAVFPPPGGQPRRARPSVNRPLGADNGGGVVHPPSARPGGTSVPESTSSFAAARSRGDPAADPPEIQLARAAVASFYRFRPPGLAPPLDIQIQEREVETYERMQIQLDEGGLSALPSPHGSGRCDAMPERSLEVRVPPDPSSWGHAHQRTTATPAVTFLPPPPRGDVHEQTSVADAGGSSSVQLTPGLGGGDPPSRGFAGAARSGATSDAQHFADTAFPGGIPGRMVATHPNRSPTNFSHEVEDLLNKLAARVVPDTPSVGHLRGIVMLYDELKGMVPTRGGLCRTLAAAQIRKGSSKTFARHKTNLALMGSVPDEAEYFETLKRLTASTNGAPAAAAGGSSSQT